MHVACYIKNPVSCQIDRALVVGLCRRLEPTQLMIENIIGMELAYINTNHPDFVGGQEGTVQSSST